MIKISKTSPNNTKYNISYRLWKYLVASAITCQRMNIPIKYPYQWIYSRLKEIENEN